mmetsp:Transcript_11501/g.34389  ORF Transcript_11501/g.34389 Transcript_11501/m.34389 type:complete len:236 (+) Transcript_11501:316-1023(+)
MSSKAARMSSPAASSGAVATTETGLLVGRRSRARSTGNDAPSRRSPSRSSRTMTEVALLRSTKSWASQSGSAKRGSAASKKSTTSARSRCLASSAAQAARVVAPAPRASFSNSTDRTPGAAGLVRKRWSQSFVGACSDARDAPCGRKRAARASTSVAAAARSSCSAASKSPFVTETTESSSAPRPRAKDAAERTRPASSAPLKSSVRAERDSSSLASTKAAALASRAPFSRIWRV